MSNPPDRNPADGIHNVRRLWQGDPIESVFGRRKPIFRTDLRVQGVDPGKRSPRGGLIVWGPLQPPLARKTVGPPHPRPTPCL